MDKEIYITRKQQWFDEDSASDISLAEWNSFVSNDPEMRLDNFTTVKLENGGDFKYDNPGAAVYLHRVAGEMTCREIAFDFLSGNIKVTGADAETIEKIRHIAFKLGAHVQATGEEIAEEIPLNDSHEPEPNFTFSDLIEPIKHILPHSDQQAGENISLNHVPDTGKK